MLVFDYVFDVPVDVLFTALADVNAMPKILGAKGRRIVDSSSDNVNGVGAVREIDIVPFVYVLQEEIKTFTPNECIEYTVTRGAFFASHWGRMEFTPHTQDGKQGSRLRYTIDLNMRWAWLTYVVARDTERKINKGLKQLQHEINAA